MTIGILLFDEVEELDFVGPWEMLTMWQQVASGPSCLTVSQGSHARCVRAAGERPSPEGQP